MLKWKEHKASLLPSEDEVREHLKQIKANIEGEPVAEVDKMNELRTYYINNKGELRHLPLHGFLPDWQIRQEQEANKK